MRKIYCCFILIFLPFCLSAQTKAKDIWLGLKYVPKNNLVILNVKPQNFGKSIFTPYQFEQIGYTGLIPSSWAFYFELDSCNYIMPIQENALFEEVYINCKKKSVTHKLFKIEQFSETIIKDIKSDNLEVKDEYLEIECIVLNHKHPHSFVKEKIEYITYIRRITRYVYR